MIGAARPHHTGSGLDVGLGVLLENTLGFLGAVEIVEALVIDTEFVMAAHLHNIQQAFLVRRRELESFEPKASSRLTVCAHTRSAHSSLLFSFRSPAN